jgi:hypothetical protein
MPYIKGSDREKFDEKLKDFPEFINKGELEYVIFKLMKMYMKNKEFRYSILHDVTYAAQHCSDEFRRRYLDEREDFACQINGDIDDE